MGYLAFINSCFFHSGYYRTSALFLLPRKGKVMTDKDFYPCYFIRDELCYITYEDFYENRKILRRFFNRLGNNAKIFYKWYVYANIHMNITYKNLIWDYLNGYDEFGFNLPKPRLPKTK